MVSEATFPNNWGYFWSTLLGLDLWDPCEGAPLVLTKIPKNNNLIIMSEIGVGVCLDEFIFGWVMIELMYNKREERRHWFMHSLRLSFSAY